ncbi:hypothetical protein [Sabulicella rubraurantiaca]|uniref:hypothetical protein n=1 Tax=Sabulicella rubraurantiaca TaxID=2811429 RepID=UPI001A95F149|nr:hypothetical protein [Sabulicella rubraurantiaca]
MISPRPSARVRRTGIALVHEGEVILPAPGSEALVERGLAAGPAAVHYHFPVEIEVTSGGAPLDLDALAEHVLARLSHGLDGAAES